ncbi:NAD dependent epimerase/dehydratase family [Verrucomicrobiia bacterium DG1235]|nr:NAD dependent epimerase/dehydratase family [Verrucomicrobiae bacterium DG1235]
MELALKRGMSVSILNRGNRKEISDTRSLVADVNDLDAARSVLGSVIWDAVVDFTAFSTEDIDRRIELFGGKTRQYIFISSASAYQKPIQDYIITESTPLVNPFWDYSRNKAACEEKLLDAVRSARLPATVVRPSLTFGDTQAPLALNSWLKPYTAIDRMRKGKSVIVPGDGTSLWTVTHNSDFAKGLVGLLGNEAAVGHAFHITSDEVLTWDQIYRYTAQAAGVEEPKLIHIASDFIAECIPDIEGSLIGDKSASAVFDNSKIKRFVPDYVATTRYADGIKSTIKNFDSDESLRSIDEEANRNYDLLIETYTAGLAAAKKAFSR